MSDWYDQYQEFSKSDWVPTSLSEKDEAQFKKDIISSKWFKQIKSDVEREEGTIKDDDLFEDLTGTHADYDYRGAWQAGATAKDYEFDEKQHWPSATDDGKILKSPTHPTAWMEFFMNATGIDPNSVGLKNAEDAKDYTEKLKDYAAFKKEGDQ